MKIEIENNKAKEIEYPCLMISDYDRIVLFTEPSKGVLLQDPSFYYKIYNTDVDWVMSNFTTFKGTITLSND